jgi:hypothetical protein
VDEEESYAASSEMKRMENLNAERYLGLSETRIVSTTQKLFNEEFAVKKKLQLILACVHF